MFLSSLKRNCLCRVKLKLEAFFSYRFQQPQSLLCLQWGRRKFYLVPHALDLLAPCLYGRELLGEFSAMGMVIDQNPNRKIVVFNLNWRMREPSTICLLLGTNEKFCSNGNQPTPIILQGKSIVFIDNSSRMCILVWPLPFCTGISFILTFLSSAIKVKHRCSLSSVCISSTGKGKIDKFVGGQIMVTQNEGKKNLPREIYKWKPTWPPLPPKKMDIYFKMKKPSHPGPTTICKQGVLAFIQRDIWPLLVTHISDLWYVGESMFHSKEGVLQVQWRGVMIGSTVDVEEGPTSDSMAFVWDRCDVWLRFFMGWSPIGEMIMLQGSW